jgi:hypothetical protein
VTPLPPVRYAAGINISGGALRAFTNLAAVGTFAFGLAVAGADGNAAVIWNSADRFVEFGTEQTPTPAGQQAGFPAISAPKVSANGFAPFNAALGGAPLSYGANQTSSIGPLSIDVAGYASHNGADVFTLNYRNLSKGESRFVVTFTVDQPTPFTLTVNPTSVSAFPVRLSAPGFPSPNYLPTGGNTAVYTGTLAPATWTFNATVPGLGGPFGVDADLVLAPEPSAALGVIAAAAVTLTRRRRRA